MRRALRVAGYRFRATFARRRGGLIAIVLMIGLVGGLALGVIAGARRTQSSYPAFLQSTNPSDLSMVGLPPNPDGDGRLLNAVTRLPGVRRVESYGAILAGPISANGAPSKAALNDVPLGSIDGIGFNQDRLTAVQGRLADPNRADEIMVTADDARMLGVHLNERVLIGAYTYQDSQEPGFGTAKVQPYRRLEVTVVGIVKFNNSIVQDDVDAAGDDYLIFTPAFTRPLTRCCNSDLYSGFQVAGGARGVSAVEREVEELIPKNSGYYVHVTSVFEAQAERAIKPEAVALGVFGIIAALAALLLAGQMVGRQLRLDTDDLAVLRAIGATPTMTTVDGLLGVVGAVVLGALFAGAVAVALSPLAPIGPARRFYPSRGIAFDWTVLGFGMLVFVVLLAAVAVVTAQRRARRDERATRASVVARGAANVGLPVAAVAGIRFALESGRGRNAAPVRSAIIGAVIAIVVVAGTLTFGASLHTLVSHPSLYGWNWNDEILTHGGGGNIPLSVADALLDRDHDIAAWSGVYFDSLRIDGQTVPIMGGQPNAAVAPPLLSGHGLDATDQIVMGATTLGQLHKHIGDTVQASYGPSASTRLRIVGTATMPAVGPADQLHLSMGTGALVAYQLIPAPVRNSGGGSGTAFEPSALFVRLRASVNPAAALTRLRQVVATKAPQSDVSVVSVQRPAEIVNYRTMGATPALLGLALATAAVCALAVTLVTSVRRRRRDLALLKTLGFTHRQLAATVAWQSSVAVAIGVIIGVPLGIIGGRALWGVFAHELHVVPQPAVPMLTIALVALGALALGNLVAALPGFQAARTNTAVLLHAE